MAGVPYELVVFTRPGRRRLVCLRSALVGVCLALVAAAPAAGNRARVELGMTALPSTPLVPGLPIAPALPAPRTPAGDREVGVPGPDNLRVTSTRGGFLDGLEGADHLVGGAGP